jgi:hypothetical protein
MSSKPDKGKESLVQVAVAPNEIVANIWKDVLEENGIRPLLQGINLVESMYTAPITLRYRVMVLSSDADKAREVLTPFIEAEESSEKDTGP